MEVNLFYCFIFFLFFFFSFCFAAKKNGLDTLTVIILPVSDLSSGSTHLVYLYSIYLYIIYIIYSLTRNFRWVSLSVFPHPSQWLTYRTHNVLRLQNTQSPWYSRYPNSSFLIPSSNAVCIPPWLFIQGSFPWTTAVVREVGVLGRRSCCNREVTICWLSC